MLPDKERFRLLKTYRPPKCYVGKFLDCRIRGRVRVASISEGLIQWPKTKYRSLIVCGDLVRAIQQESSQAVAKLWGVHPTLVWLWRKALGVPQNNKGTRILRSKWWRDGGVGEKTRPGREATYASEERRRKISEARKGKPRPPHVIEAMRQANLGRKASEESREKMRQAQRARGSYPPAAGRPFSPAEDAVLGTRPDREIADRLERSRYTIKARRRRLGIPSWRKREKGS